MTSARCLPWNSARPSSFLVGWRLLKKEVERFKIDRTARNKKSNLQKAAFGRQYLVLYGLALIHICSQLAKRQPHCVITLARSLWLHISLTASSDDALRISSGNRHEFQSLRATSFHADIETTCTISLCRSVEKPMW